MVRNKPHVTLTILRRILDLRGRSAFFLTWQCFAAWAGWIHKYMAFGCLEKRKSIVRRLLFNELNRIASGVYANFLSLTQLERFLIFLNRWLFKRTLTMPFVNNRSDEGLTLETSAFKLLAVVNLRYQLNLVILNYPVIFSHRRSTTFSLEITPFTLVNIPWRRLYYR